MVYVLIASITVILLLTVFPFYAAVVVGFEPYANRLAQSIAMGPKLGDGFGNFLLFIPFGYAAIRLAIARIAASPAGHAITITCLGALMSFLIEGSQMLMPRRSPSLYDIAFNTLGTAAGAILGVWLCMLKRKRSAPVTAE